MINVNNLQDEYKQDHKKDITTLLQYFIIFRVLEGKSNY